MNKKQYQAPQVEQMDCKVEKGFAGSATQPANETLQDGQSYNESNFQFS